MDFLILSIISLITLINPVGIIPTYLNIIENFNDKEQKEITFKACIVAFILLLIFAIMGTFIFNFFNLTIYAFKIVVGILFLEMQINLSLIKSQKIELKEYETGKA